ncbi:MAG: hypothetical protein JJU34_01810 [Lunatimonas sp.]|uniref:hypothetical protein n=1 Tax=Lunatimonas sp. TaxID=2060141 RepID=UPI00263AEE20|nr:hypothetical protein [Lunatimonas sp.]MCC5935993.1 hypothetical protein [Lunatimonas sp.]
MANRWFIAFAALLTSIVLAYAHLKVYFEFIQGKEQPIPEGIMQFHGTEPVLSPMATLAFGLVFAMLAVGAAYFSLLSKHREVFFVLVICLLMIWVRLLAGAV